MSRATRAATGALTAVLLLACVACGKDGDEATAEAARSTAEPAPSPGPYETHRQRFLDFYIKKDWPNALAEATAALDAAPDRREAFMLVSKTFIESGEDSEAVSFFARRAAAVPSRAEPWFFKGFHEARLGRWDEAIDSLGKAVSLAPDDSETRFRLGQALLQGHKPERAVAELRRACELDPGSPPKTAGLLMALAATGNVAEAEKVAADLLARSPDSAEARFAVAQLRLRQGRVGEAEALLRRALELNPAFGPARIDLDRLAKR